MSDPRTTALIRRTYPLPHRPARERPSSPLGSDRDWYDSRGAYEAYRPTYRDEIHEDRHLRTDSYRPRYRRHDDDDDRVPREAVPESEAWAVYHKTRDDEERNRETRASMRAHGDPVPSHHRHLQPRPSHMAYPIWPANGIAPPKPPQPVARVRIPNPLPGVTKASRAKPILNADGSPAVHNGRVMKAKEFRPRSPTRYGGPTGFFVPRVSFKEYLDSVEARAAEMAERELRGLAANPPREPWAMREAKRKQAKRSKHDVDDPFTATADTNTTSRPVLTSQPPSHTLWVPGTAPSEPLSAPLNIVAPGYVPRGGYRGKPVPQRCSNGREYDKEENRLARERAAAPRPGSYYRPTERRPLILAPTRHLEVSSRPPKLNPRKVPPGWVHPSQRSATIRSPSPPPQFDFLRLPGLLDHLLPPQHHLDEPEYLVGGKKWRSASQRFNEEILEIIFNYLKDDIMKDVLPLVPIKGRDPWLGVLNNSRLSNSEINAYKTAMIRKQMFDIGKVCKSWWCGAQKEWHDVVIIGKRDCEAAIKNIRRWIPLKDVNNLRLTLQMPFDNVYRLLRTLGNQAPGKETFNLRKLTILHGFAPEEFGNRSFSEWDSMLSKLRVKELEIELYAGNPIVIVESLDTVARALRFPWGYKSPGSAWRYKVEVVTEAEEELINDVSPPKTPRAMVKDIRGEEEDEETMMNDAVATEISGPDAKGEAHANAARKVKSSAAQEDLHANVDPSPISRLANRVTSRLSDIPSMTKQEQRIFFPNSVKGEAKHKHRKLKMFAPSIIAMPVEAKRLRAAEQEKLDAARAQAHADRKARKRAKVNARTHAPSANPYLTLRDRTLLAQPMISVAERSRMRRLLARPLEEQPDYRRARLQATWKAVNEAMFTVPFGGLDGQHYDGPVAIPIWRVREAILAAEKKGRGEQVEELVTIIGVEGEAEATQKRAEAERKKKQEEQRLDAELEEDLAQLVLLLHQAWVVELAQYEEQEKAKRLLLEAEKISAEVIDEGEESDESSLWTEEPELQVDIGPAEYAPAGNPLAADKAGDEGSRKRKREESVDILDDQLLRVPNAPVDAGIGGKCLKRKREVEDDGDGGLASEEVDEDLEEDIRQEKAYRYFDHVESISHARSHCQATAGSDGASEAVVDDVLIADSADHDGKDDEEFVPDTAEKRAAGYLYAMERPDWHLHLPAIGRSGLPYTEDEKARLTLWSEMFGDNDQIRREFTEADKKWLEILDKSRPKHGWRPPIGWKIGDSDPLDMIKTFLDAWRGCVESLTIRATWLDLYREICKKVKHGVLRSFDYHFVPIPAKTIEKTLHRRRKHKSPIPPLGSLKSLDNILMWDFRQRVDKWYRAIMIERAKRKGEVWQEPPITRKLSWRVHVPFNLWVQQKDRAKFKGIGNELPWTSRTTDVIAAMKKYLLAEGEMYIAPIEADDEDWSDKQYFDEMTSWVLNTKPPKPRARPQFPGPVHLITRGNLVDAQWLKDHIERQQANMSIIRQIWNDREERAVNDPNGADRRRKFNDAWMYHWLESQGEEGRKKLLDRLRKTKGSMRLWEACHWPLYHEKYPTVKVLCEVREA